MVGAGVVIRELGIPRGTLHRLVRQGRIPAIEVTQPWNTRRQWRFKLSEVRAALARPASTRELRRR